jgi:hypothetical protein
LFPAVGLVRSIFAEANAHVRAGFDDRFLLWESILWVEVCGVKIADVNLLLLRLASDLVADVGHEERVFHMHSASSEVATM